MYIVIYVLRAQNICKHQQKAIKQNKTKSQSLLPGYSFTTQFWNQFKQWLTIIQEQLKCLPSDNSNCFRCSNNQIGPETKDCSDFSSFFSFGIGPNRPLTCLTLMVTVSIFTPAADQLSSFRAPTLWLIDLTSPPAIFKPLFSHEKTDKTGEYLKCAVFVCYENGRRWLLGTQNKL